MKGLAVSTIILLIIGVIVMAVALYFLVYVTNFDALFLSNDQRILKQYSSCALAYCTNGADSNQVRLVGCLKSEGGKCTLTCTQVENEVYIKNNVRPITSPTNVKYYCGKESALTFEFSGVSLGGTVPLRSGQMVNLANSPSWICRPIKIPFTNAYFDDFGIDTADFQYNFGGHNCIILAKNAPDTLSYIPTNLVAKPGYASGGGCFTGIFYDTKVGQESLYTPLLSFQDSGQKTWPSGIYLNENDHFTQILSGSSTPECELNGPSKFAKQTQLDLANEIKDILSKATSKNFVIDTRCPSEPSATDPTSQSCIPKEYSTEEAKNLKLESYQKLISFSELNPVFQNQYAYNLIKTETGPSSTLNSDTAGTLINSCNFKTTYNNKKIVYSVYAEATFPGEFLVGKPSDKQYATLGSGDYGFVYDFLYLIGPDVASSWDQFLNSAVDKLVGSVEKPLSSVSGSCATVTLTRDLNGASVSSKDQTSQSVLSFSEPAAVSGLSTPATSSYALGDGSNLYLFYQKNSGATMFSNAQNGDVNEIHYAVSGDSGKTWQDKQIAADNLVSAFEPTAVSFNNKIYLAFGNRSEVDRKVRFTINFTALDGSRSMLISDDFDGTKEKGGPSMAVLGGNLYLLYHQKEGNGRYDIYYRTWDGKNDWSDAIKVPTPSPNGEMNSDNTDSMYPSAYSDGQNIQISYSFSNSDNKLTIFGWPGITSFDIYALSFNGGGTSTELGSTGGKAGKVSDDNEQNGLRRQGFSKILQYGGDTYVFYDEDKIEPTDPTSIDSFQAHVGYKKLVNGEWQGAEEMFASKTKAIQPNPVAVGDNLMLFFSSYEGSAWNILSSTGTKAVTQPAGAQKTVKTFDFGSDPADKSSYNKDDAVKFKGDLTFNQGSSEGETVNLALNFNGGFPIGTFPKSAMVKSDGTFSFEYTPTDVGSYKATATYGTRSTDFSFTVN